MIKNKFLFFTYIIIILISLFYIPSQINYIADGSYIHLTNAMINSATVKQPHYLYGSFPIYITLFFYYFIENLNLYYIPIYLSSLLLIWYFNQNIRYYLKEFQINNFYLKNFFIVLPIFLFLTSLSFYTNLINSLSHIYGTIFFWVCLFHYWNNRLYGNKVDNKNNYYLIGIYSGIAASCLYYYGSVLFLIFIFEFLNKNKNFKFFFLNTSLVSFVVFILFNFYPILQLEEVIKWFKISLGLAGEAEYKFSENLLARFAIKGFVLEFGIIQYALSLVSLIYIFAKIKKSNFNYQFIFTLLFLLFFYVYFFKFYKLHYIVHFIPALCFLATYSLILIYKYSKSKILIYSFLLIIITQNLFILNKFDNYYKNDHTFLISKELFSYYYGEKRDPKIFCTWCDEYMIFYLDPKNLIRSMDNDLSKSDLDLIIFDNEANGIFLQDRIKVIPKKIKYLKKYKNFDNYYLLRINPFHKNYKNKKWILNKYEKSYLVDSFTKIRRGPLIEFYFRDKYLRDLLFDKCVIEYEDTCEKESISNNFFLNEINFKLKKLN